MIIDQKPYRQRQITEYEIKKDKDGYKSDARFKYIYMGDADDPRCINAIILIKRAWYICSLPDQSNYFFLSIPFKTQRITRTILLHEYRKRQICLIKTDQLIYLPQTIFKMPIEKKER